MVVRPLDSSDEGTIHLTESVRKEVMEASQLYFDEVILARLNGVNERQVAIRQKQITVSLCPEAYEAFCVLWEEADIGSGVYYLRVDHGDELIEKAKLLGAEETDVMKALRNKANFHMGDGAFESLVGEWTTEFMPLLDNIDPADRALKHAGFVLLKTCLYLEGARHTEALQTLSPYMYMLKSLPECSEFSRTLYEDIESSFQELPIQD